MVPDDHSLFLLKVGAKKWLTKLKSGELSFSCPGQYVRIAKLEGNMEQGDLYEAVFARLKKNDPRVIECENRFGNDLEVIPDGEYVLLRRKSSLFVPTFCFYSYRGFDVLDNVSAPGKQTITHYFDERIFSGFTNDKAKNVISPGSSPAALILHAFPFRIQVADALIRNGLSFDIRHINYSAFEEDVFFIEPTNKREELFYKFPKYSYQKEARIVLHGMKLPTIYDRYSLDIGQLSKGSASMIENGQFYVQFEADIVEVD